MKPRINQDKIARYLAYIVAAILAIMPFAAFLSSWAGNNFQHLDLFRIWKEILIVIITPLALYLGWTKETTRKFLKKSPIVLLFVAYILLHIILGAWALKSHNVNKTAFIYSLISNLRFIGFFIITYLIASRNNYLQRNIKNIIVLPSLVVIAFGLAQKFLLPHSFLKYFYGNTMPTYQTIDGNNNLQRVQSSLRGANPLGAYLIVVLGAFAAYIRQKYIRAILLISGLIVLFYSYSRSAWLGTIISLWLLSWWTALKAHHRTWLLSSIFIGFFLVGGTFYMFKNKPVAQDTLFHTSSVSKSPISSNEARRISLKNGLHDVIHQPIGEGPGTAGPASFHNKPHSTRISENYFLQIGQEVGILGMLIFIAINVLVARELWIRKTPLAHLLLATLAGITFVNLLSHAWADDTLSLIWWGLAGICLAPLIKTGSQRTPKIIKK